MNILVVSILLSIITFMRYPDLPVPLLFICFVSFCCGQSQDISQDPQLLSTTRHWPFLCWNQHQSHQSSEPNQAKPLHRGNMILCMVKELTVTNLTLWKQTLLLRGQNVPRMNTYPSTPNLVTGQPRGNCSSPPQPNSWLSPRITFPCCLVWFWPGLTAPPYY